MEKHINIPYINRATKQQTEKKKKKNTYTQSVMVNSKEPNLTKASSEKLERNKRPMCVCTCVVWVLKLKPLVCETSGTTRQNSKMKSTRGKHNTRTESKH